MITENFNVEDMVRDQQLIDRKERKDLTYVDKVLWNMQFVRLIIFGRHAASWIVLAALFVKNPKHSKAYEGTITRG